MSKALLETSEVQRNVSFRLVDLGEDNDRNLKMPAEIAAERAAAGGTETVETAEKVTTQMAEEAGERPVKVNETNDDRSSSAKKSDVIDSHLSLKESSNAPADEYAISAQCCK